jgi:hypothetical protein
MKTLFGYFLTLSLAVVSLGVSFAAEAPPLATSVTTNGLFFILTTGERFFSPHVGGDKPATVDDEIIYQVRTSEEKSIRVAIPHDPRYLCRMKLFTPSGREARATARGKRYGTRFDEADYSNCNPAGVIAEPPPASPGGTLLGHIRDFFEINEKGLFILEFQFQAFKPTKSKSHVLVKFAPVRVPLSNNPLGSK